MNKDIKKALETLKKNCKKYNHCYGCELLKPDNSCYVFNVIPEEYDAEYEGD